MAATLSASPASYLETLEQVVNEVIAPAAVVVDQTGAFPRAGIDALGQAGLLGLISAPEVGGLGQSHRAAALAVERVAQACGSTAALPTIRAYAARMQIKTDMTRALLLDTFDALETGRADTMLRVLEVKAAAGETAARSLMAGTADAACLIEGNYYLFQAEGTLPQGATRVLTQTSRFDHCNFTVISSAPHGSVARFRDLLFAMSYDDPQLNGLMAIEGLQSWKEGRTAGYEPLTAAVNTVRIAV
ncbi:MAG: acyl-CoA dehydrogenase family protein [Chloroflexota bacterium]|nr:acyl-CoA dehydrogenase family protein [Chloroflexota bacterium]